MNDPKGKELLVNIETSSAPTQESVRLADRPCPACGMPAAAMLAALPSGRRALLQACAICGSQDATPIHAKQAEHALKDTLPCATGETV